ncbi:Spc97 / Spc98 family of spindle pole body (SBP) component [Actinidia rufa]|uniref:Gamma-tubulin complex component n=1 Tax=Actinidia rufa TaxID=165716 RepID=A0A7J0EKA0_9ERIC|nr:Spc97 / Spc98 family of spindle pole body (SBP) component [Actinidia rufa]
MEPSVSLINKIYSAFSDGIHFATPISSLRTNEVDLDFHAKRGIYVTHLSQTSLHVILNQFTYAATCLKLVEVVANKVETSVRLPSPTLRAFACSVSAWLKRLRDMALKEEVNIRNSNSGTAPTLLGLASSLSRFVQLACKFFQDVNSYRSLGHAASAEYLLQIVHGAIPKVYFEPDSSVPAAEIAVHILDHLYKKLNEICPVQGGEEDAYRMLLYIFVGSLLPYIEGLDSWLFEGTLDDPFEEMFFYANKAISVDEADFWEKSYLLRRIQYQKLDVSDITNRILLTDDKKEMLGRESISMSSPIKGKGQNNSNIQICPSFIKEIATAIVSSGKSLQLIQHAPMMFSPSSGRGDNHEIGDCGNLSNNNPSKICDGQSLSGLTLSEVFCLSLAGLIGHGDHLSKYIWQEEPSNSKMALCFNPLWTKRNLKEVTVRSCQQ